MAKQNDRTHLAPTSSAPNDPLADSVFDPIWIENKGEALAIDPRQLRPSDLCRLLNSTPVGEVIDDRRLRGHRTRAGFRLAAHGDERKIDLFRYTAWLAGRRHTRLSDDAKSATQLSAYEAYRDTKGREARAQSLSGRDIGPLPDVVDPDRRAACERDFRAFCDRYFPLTFFMAWSDDHLKVIGTIERAVLDGGLFAMAMPRGSGKTSLCEIACLWSLLYSHRPFVALVGADETAATEMLDAIKVEIENNDDLLGDFPEVCYPVRHLEGIHQRANGQLLDGVPTLIGWTAKEIVLPTVAGSKTSGSIIRVSGITGRIRGMKHKRADGSSIRPSLVLVDDPQTDESANSPTQCAARERILSGAILGLAGPGQKIAGLMPLTVVRPDDMADRILDREKHPSWQGERMKMVYSFPTNEKLWDEYAKIRADGHRCGDLSLATKFYGEHRAEMDDGAVVAWESRKYEDDLSAIQHAMNIRFDRKDPAFFAEYQNEPLPEVAGDDELLDADAISLKTNGHRKGLAPLTTTTTTMFIDIQGKALYWLIAAWQDDFTGYVIDYGTEPDQKRVYFTLRDIRRTLKIASPKAGQEGAIYTGLERLCERTLGREWKTDGGGTARIDRCLIDANWGETTDVIYQFCRQSKYSGVVMPSHGRYVGASSIPFGDHKRKRGERVGLNWLVPIVTGKRAVRRVNFDTNYWKSFVQARLATTMGDPGSMSLFKGSPERHRLLAEHLTAEYRVKTEGRGRTVHEWKLRAGGLDNHWLDCLVGATVAASMQGPTLFGTDSKPKPRKAMRLSDMQKGR